METNGERLRMRYGDLWTSKFRDSNTHSSSTGEVRLIVRVSTQASFAFVKRHQSVPSG